MEELIQKSFEYNYTLDGDTYFVRVFVNTIADDVKISNIDVDDFKGFIYKVSVLVNPSISNNILNTKQNIVYLFGRGENHRIGYIISDEFVELESNDFIQILKVNLLSILIAVSNTGHFKIDF